VVKSVLLCPGQGAQFVGMGRDVAEQFPAARAVFQAVDDALGFDLSQLMWQGPEAELTLTHNAQPAILAHTLAVHSVVRAALEPVLAAGHSLGEYSAYSIAGSLGLADAARLVRRRGELMLAAGEARAGTMTAVLGLNAVEVEAICRDSSVDGSVVVAANINAPDQTVLSGDPDAVERAGDRCKQAGAKRVLPLKVSGAFHSPLMEPAALGLQTVLDSIELPEIKTRHVANLLDRFEVAKALLVDVDNNVLARSARNIPTSAYLPVGGLNVYDILRHDTLLISKDAAKAIEGRLGS